MFVEFYKFSRQGKQMDNGRVFLIDPVLEQVGEKDF